MQGLAQEVLLQRSEVEAFLVSSIQQARAEMAAQAAAGGACSPPAAQASAAGQPSAALNWSTGDAVEASASGLAGAAPAAECSSRSGGSAGAAAPSCSSGPWVAKDAAPSASASSMTSAPGGLDIRELSWQDRERILRLLFAKINRAAAVVGGTLVHLWAGAFACCVSCASCLAPALNRPCSPLPPTPATCAAGTGSLPGAHASPVRGAVGGTPGAAAGAGNGGRACGPGVAGWRVDGQDITVRQWTAVPQN